MTQPTDRPLSAAETKEIITPYAFSVEQSLFGLALATPNRRAVAMFIDFIIVGMLAQQDVALLVILAAATFFRAGKAKPSYQKWRRTRTFLRGLGIAMMALLAYSLLDSTIDKYTQADAQVEVVSQKAAGQSAPNLVIETSTDKPQQQATDDAPQGASLTDWLKGIIEKDLGFGFGWAALYFTVFTAWWGGQTPGKRMVGISVIKLDGKPISLWDAFGRYGGYGAGFATGLLGFAQIYWDPNRQAIHDKISATVVILGQLSQKHHSASDTTATDGQKKDESQSNI